MEKFSKTKNNIIYIAKNWYKWDRRGTIFAFLRIPVAIVIPTLIAIIPKVIIETIERGISLEQFIFTISIFFSLAILLSWIQPMLEEKLNAFQKNISMHYAVEAFHKLLDMNYSVLESYDGRYKYERCKKFAFSGNTSDGAWAIVRVTGLLTALFGITTYLAIISIVDFKLVLLILLTCSFEYLFNKAITKVATHTENIMAKQELKFSYFFRIASDSNIAKDTRIFDAKDWLCQHLSKAVIAYTNILHWDTQKTTKLTLSQSVCALIRDIATFIFLIVSVLNGKISVADFTFYFGLISGFSIWINEISGHLTSLQRISGEAEKYQEFINLPNTILDENCNKCSLSVIEKIEFRDVCFDYGDGKEVLSNINFVVNKGEKIAIVGENGAGKTTLIKILCGLYKPTKGSILINNKDISCFNLSEYYNCLSAIFQEFVLLPTTLFSNITGNSSGNPKSVEWAIEQAGLKEKISQLPNGLNTNLITQMNDIATDFSGGEQQKLLLARAIYKDSSVLVLDEPTSAMDALAEEALYQKYAEISKEKISFFISHRLTSTKFCTKIFFLKNGTITETGSHRELLNLGKEYKEMYNIQGIYYRKEGEII